MSRMNVKNKIASFEAYNEKVAKTITSSPKASSSEKQNLTEASLRERSSGTSSKNTSDDDGVSAVSSTSKASQNRRNRLSNNSPLRDKQHEARRNIYERRRLRQQQRNKGKQQQQDPPANMPPSATRTSTRTTTNPPPQGQSASFRRRSTQQQRNSATNDETMTSNRRFVHTISHESSAEMGHSNSGEGGVDNDNTKPNNNELLSPNRRLSPARIAKAYRMQRMRNAVEEQQANGKIPNSPHRGAAQPTNGPPSPNTPQEAQLRSYEDDDSQFNSVSNVYTGDDDVTLTSVRQVVTGSNHSRNTSLQPKSQDVHRNMNGVAAAYGYTDNNNNTKQSWVEKGHDQNGVVLRMASSSDYDSDGNAKRERRALDMSRGVPAAEPPDSAMKAFLDQSRSSRLGDEDDLTFDYGSLNDESTHASFDTQKREEERKAKQAMDQQASVGFVPDEVTSPLINKDDLEFYKKSLDSGVTKAAAGIVAAGAVGGVALGPVGVLLGVAAVGIGVGAMQIPEEQRANVKEKATNAVLSATEKISTSCATACAQSGMIDQLPPEMTKCYTPTDGEDGTDGTVTDPEGNETASVKQNGGAADGNEATEKANGSGGGGGGNNFNSTMRGLIPEGNNRKSASPARRAACLRDVRIIPVSQIHGLAPTQQPRAWLDVMASANTTMSEKNEAMEEIQILAKDKKHARVFLEEGILDSLMWVINNHFAQRDNGSGIPVPPAEKSMARLAASCCLTLGKAHCALVHTGGDLLLMSMYEHGKVPEDRQLAQMLYETPHHVRVTKAGDPSVIQPGKEVFVLTSLTMSQAQELARSLMQLADGQ